MTAATKLIDIDLRYTATISCMSWNRSFGGMDWLEDRWVGQICGFACFLSFVSMSILFAQRFYDKERVSPESLTPNVC